MEHLSTETLARLIDEVPTAVEAEHLAGCGPCASELTALRDQTEALSGLPEIMPPQGDWQVLEAQLRSEGLVQSPGLFQTLGLAQTPQWMRAAAAVLLFLGGAGTGAAFTSGPDVARAATVEEAASAVRMAEEGYVTALDQYRSLLAAGGGGEFVADPIGRYAALEHLVSVSQAAVRQVPADPFLNGILTSALAERDAMARLVSTTGGSPLRTASRGNWF